MREVKLRGRSGSDAELKYTQNGTAVINLSLAVNEKRNDAVETHWFKVNIWSKQAEELQPLIKKGTLLSIHGKLESRSWQDKNGNRRESVEISAFICDVVVPRTYKPGTHETASDQSQDEGLSL